ncbi:hypothetical protein NDN08_002432 [Rhodosorus marinus]|uniref:RING-type E3 ubiquitin transferase n=1 Tax=Rhodosorus marinus TaxID=101924 RepID=A0AAV8UTP7_9RHOD|nr:hypothetical protein NDN08_002432 [Rhodosorus marinus]
MNVDDIWGSTSSVASGAGSMPWVATRAKTSRFFAQRDSAEAAGGSQGREQIKPEEAIQSEQNKLSLLGREIEGTSSNVWSSVFGDGQKGTGTSDPFGNPLPEDESLAWKTSGMSLWTSPFESKSAEESDDDARHSNTAPQGLNVAATEGKTATTPPKKADSGLTQFRMTTKNFYSEQSKAVPFTPQKEKPTLIVMEREVVFAQEEAFDPGPLAEDEPEVDEDVEPAIEPDAYMNGFKTNVPCKFFLEGFCANSDSCRYLHHTDESVQGYTHPVEYDINIAHVNESGILQPDPAMEARNVLQPLYPSGVSSWDPSGELCSFHVTNDCRYGSTCRYLHGNQCSYCLSNVLHPVDEDRADEHVQNCAAMMGISQTTSTEAQESITCGICMNQTRGLGRKFGMLMNCTHAFCLECIREYRGNDFSGRTIRACPICYVESDLVLPSFTFVLDPQKRKELFAGHTGRLSEIPCKHFSYGEGNCPLGADCYFAHVDARKLRTTLVSSAKR